MTKKILTLLLLSGFVFFSQVSYSGEEVEEEKKGNKGPAYGKAKVTSEYVYRGVPQGGSSVQGSLNSNFLGLLAKAWVANNPLLDSPEGRFSLGYKFEDGRDLGMGLWLKATHYNFMRNSSNNMNEYSLGVSWAERIFLSVNYADEWRTLDESNLFIELNGKFKLGRGVKLLLTVGQTLVDNETTFGYDDYLNYGAGLGFYSNGIFYILEWSDTDRESVAGATSADLDDGSLRFSLSIDY